MKHFIDISKELGQRILAEKKLGEVSVLHVDFTAEHGGGCPTCYWTNYPVVVHYINVHGVEAKATKTYEDMSEIIKEMEDIAEEIYD